MSRREDLLSCWRRTGYKRGHWDFNLCPDLTKEFEKRYPGNGGDYGTYFGFTMKNIGPGKFKFVDHDAYRRYHTKLSPEGWTNDYGVGYERGSEKAKHMHRMICPMSGIDSLDRIKEYPFIDFADADYSRQKAEADAIKKEDRVAVGYMAMTVWEASWYLRGMEDMMADMMTGDPIADYIFDKVTRNSMINARHYAEAGADVLYIGDDIGMQKTAMMSHELYRSYIKPRLIKIIDSAKKIKPDIIVVYHSCGYVLPFIDDLIEAGIDVLNPVQPECMSFEEVHERWGDRLSFLGTIGTQTTMPFGAPADVRREVEKNLSIAGDRGGLMCAPTHMLEPEVPWENIMAYMDACGNFK